MHRRALIATFALLVACSSNHQDQSQPVDDNIYVSDVDRFGHASGNVTEVVDKSRNLVGATAVVDGKSFVGTVRSDGTAVIANVPNGPYILELRFASTVPGDPAMVVQYPVDGSRKIRLGSNYWARHDAVALAPTAKLALSVTSPATFTSGDELSWVGLRSYLYRTTGYFPADPDPIEGQSNVPAEGAATSSDWTFDASVLDAPYGSEASGLPTASAGDDLKLVQHRRATVKRDGDRFDPWTSFRKSEAVGVLDVTDASFANDKTNLISGTLSAPATEKLSIDFRGSTFAELRIAGSYPRDIRARAYVGMNQEAGAGPQLFTSVSLASWSLTATGTPDPVLPECYPVSGVCADGCTECVSDIKGYRDPGDLSYSFDAPRVYATGMRDFYELSYSYYLSWKHPKTGDSATLSASAASYRPKTGSSATFALELGPVQGIGIGDKELSWDTAAEGVGTTPTIVFAPPKSGTPEYYQVHVVELLPDAGTESAEPRATRTAASIFTRSTSVKVPDGVLRSNHYYYVRVYAIRDGKDFTEPSIYETDTSLSTGIFSPVFTP